MVTQRQVKPEKQVPFWHRKLGKPDSARSMSMRNILPESWYLVRVKIVKLEGNTCLLEVSKLD